MLELMIYDFKVIKAFIRKGIMTFIEYRANFLLDICTNLAWPVLQLFFISIIFYNTPAVNGWSKYEMIMLYGISQVIFPLFRAFALSSLHRMEEYILKGTMDYILLKPVNEKFYMTLHNVYIFQAFPLIYGVGVMVYAMSRLHIALSVGQIVLFILLIGIGVRILYLMYMICITCTFKFVKSNFLTDIILSFNSCMQYPVDIYNGIFKYVITLIIPVGIIVDFPARVLVKAFTWDKLLYAAILAVVLTFARDLVWKWGVSEYTSASS